MSIPYPHSCLVTRATESISSTGGVPVAGEIARIYCGRCDAQENSRQFNIQSGLVTSKGSATIYLPVSMQEAGIARGDDVVITWPGGSMSSGRIESTSNLDDTFLLLYS